MKDTFPEINFEETVEKSRLCLPGKGNRASHLKICWRKDPLTGKLSVIGEGLLKKVEIIFGETDYELIQQIAEQSRKTCFFCKPKVFEFTPTYPSEFIPDGRLSGPETIMFPNLFPLAQIHSVGTWPEHHFWEPRDFTSERLKDILILSSEFIRRLDTHLPKIGFISINANHLPPAGASLFHPHIQIFGSETTPYIVRETIDAVASYRASTGSCYWENLVSKEKETGNRWIGRTGNWSWVAAFSPQGSNEILGIHSTADSPFQLKDADYTELASGLARILAYYSRCKYSSFNFSLTGGVKSSDDQTRCVMRVISRQNFSSNYRTDDYFLQKLLGLELVVVPPEALAADLRPAFD